MIGMNAILPIPAKYMIADPYTGHIAHTGHTSHILAILTILTILAILVILAYLATHMLDVFWRRRSRT